MLSSLSPETSRRDRTLIMGVGVTVLLWASAFVGIRYAIATYPPGTLALLRFLIASTLLIAYTFATGRARVTSVSSREAIGVLVMGATGVFGYHVALNIGEQTVSAGAASLLVNTTPIFTVVLATLMLGERLPARAIFGIAVAFLGAALVSLGASDRLELSTGALWILLAAVLQAVYFIEQKRLLRRFRVLELTTASSLCGCFLLGVFGPQLVATIRTVPWTPTLVVVALGVGPSAIGYLSWAHVVQRISVSRAVTFLYLVPVLALILGWIVLGERPGALSLLGGVATIAGVATVHRRRR